MIGLEKLKSIGAHKIFETTHIAKKFVQDILDEKFSSMSKVQFSGFISILEREYNVDLQELTKAYGIEPKAQEKTKSEPFVVTSAEENGEAGSKKTILIVAGLILAGIILAIISFSGSNEDKKIVETPVIVENVVSELNNTTIEEAKTTLNQLDNNALEENQADTKEAKLEELIVEPVHTTKFLVTPKSKLWVGIVNLETFKRTQKLGSTPFELDPDQEWLLVMGHGYVNFEINEEEKKFNDKNKVWFAYENGSFSKITRSQFKEKNRGKAW